MNLNDSNSIANGLDEKNRTSILQLIDLKTESDMEKILAKMESMFAQVGSRMDAKFAQVDSRMDAKFAQIDSRIDAKFAQIDSKFAHVEGSITTVRWVIIVAGGLLGAMLTIIATK